MIFVDTNVLMYAVGRAHPLRAPARAFFEDALRRQESLPDQTVEPRLVRGEILCQLVRGSPDRRGTNRLVGFLGAARPRAVDRGF